jgi:hypothetical protein
VHRVQICDRLVIFALILITMILRPQGILGTAEISASFDSSGMDKQTGDLK